MCQSLLLVVLTSLCWITVCHQHVYHFINENKTWTEAKTFCKTNYTDLATVDNSTDVTTICPNPKNCENAWINWIRPTDMYYPNLSNWKNEEHDSRNCIYVTIKQNKWSWHTGSCNDNKRYACYNCKNDDYTTSTDEKNWLQALKNCLSKGQTMISEHNTLSEKLINSTIGLGEYTHWWIGLYWCPVGHSNLSKELCCESLEDKCAIINSNYWMTENCAREHPFICYDEQFVLINQTLNWEEALLFCRRNYCDLASMVDNLEQEEVIKKAKMANTDFVWVGLHYVGFFEEWVWVNGKWVSSSDPNWKNTKPNDCSVSGAMQRGGKNKWVKMHSDKRYNFVCTIHC